AFSNAPLYLWARPLRFPMPPVDIAKAEKGTPGKSGPAVAALYKPKASAPKHHHPDLCHATQQAEKQNPRRPPRVLALPISNGASSIASALGFRLGATPHGRVHTNTLSPAPISKPDIFTLLGIGRFYFALTYKTLLVFPACSTFNG